MAINGDTIRDWSLKRAFLRGLFYDIIIFGAFFVFGLIALPFFGLESVWQVFGSGKQVTAAWLMLLLVFILLRWIFSGYVIRVIDKLVDKMFGGKH